MTQEAAPIGLDTLLAGANGRRRARTLSRNDVERLVVEASKSPTGVAFRHGGQSDARARTTLCLVVVEDDRVTAGIAEVSAQDADPGRAWAELRPWNLSVVEANVARARAWAARAKPDRVKWVLAKPGKRDGAALLAKVLARPDEDEPRLVYADYLSERGDPRGELITVQCRRAKLSASDPAERALRERELQLLQHESVKKSLSGWLGFEWSPVVMAGHAVVQGQGNHGADSVVVERGFITGVSAQGARLADSASLMDTEPVQRLVVSTAGPADGARIAAFHGLERVRELELFSLRPLEAEGLSLLLESRELKQLRRLSLQRQRLGDDGLMFLTARAPEALPGLRALELHEDPCSAEQLRSLRQTQWCRRLNALSLNHSLADPGSGLLALAEGAHCDWVTLELEHNGLTAANARALFFSGAVGALRRLSLRRNNLATVAALLASPLLDRLEHFDLSGNPLSDSARSVLRARLGERVVLD